MTTETCRHNHNAPTAILTRLHESQAGKHRHKCCVCAYHEGRQVALKKKAQPAGDMQRCHAGRFLSKPFLRKLPQSQAGEGRHKCAICAYHAGFRTAREQGAASTELSYKGFGDGTKKYQQRAREVLPLLVALAKSRNTITYGRLAPMIDMPNPRNLNAVLGAVGTELRNLGREWREKIPPLNCLVLNKHLKTPREGIQFYMAPAKFARFSHAKQQKILHALYEAVWNYPRWDAVLHHFNLEPVMPAKSKTLQAIANQAKYGRGGVETKDHRRLKEYVKAHPHVVGLPKSLRGKTEFEFRSSDKIDVLFRSSSVWVGVEVKSLRSDELDLMRGIFQCVKYKALIEATQKLEQPKAYNRVILVLAGALPPKLRSVAVQLQVDFKQGVAVPPTFRLRN
jgi:hypothetical protein